MTDFNSIEETAHLYIIFSFLIIFLYFLASGQSDNLGHLVADNKTKKIKSLLSSNYENNFSDH